MSETQKHTKPNVPNLRFPGFEGEWECKQVKDIAPLQRGFDLPSQSLKEGMYPVVYSNGVMNYHREYKCEAPGLVTGRSGTIGKLTFIEEGKYWPHNTALWVTDFKNNYPKFIFYFYEHLDLSRFSSGSGVPTLNRNDVHAYKALVPSLLEQKRIASFLTLIDQRITLQNRVIEDLKRIESALCELLFDESAPNCRLGEIIEQVSERNKKRCLNNVLSVSNRYGFIEQSKQFEDRTVASEDTSNYKIVFLNDFAYNPARINVGSIARLKHLTAGIISPMYICFRAREIVIPEYLESFFDTKYFILEMRNRLEGSVRMCLSYEGLCSIPIFIPSLQEQRKISSRIETLKQKLALEETILEKMIEERQYLLSTLFI